MGRRCHRADRRRHSVQRTNGPRDHSRVVPRPRRTRRPGTGPLVIRRRHRPLRLVAPPSRPARRRRRTRRPHGGADRRPRGSAGPAPRRARRARRRNTVGSLGYRRRYRVRLTAHHHPTEPHHRVRRIRRRVRPRCRTPHRPPGNGSTAAHLTTARSSHPSPAHRRRRRRARTSDHLRQQRPSRRHACRRGGRLPAPIRSARRHQRRRLHRLRRRIRRRFRVGTGRSRGPCDRRRARHRVDRSGRTGCGPEHPTASRRRRGRGSRHRFGRGRAPPGRHVTRLRHGTGLRRLESRCAPVESAARSADLRRLRRSLSTHGNASHH